MHPNQIVPLTALALLLAGAGSPARAGTTEPVSVTPHGRVGNGASYVPVLSRDGSFVAFTSLATDLVPGDTNDTYDAFVRDRQKGVTERVSVGPGGREASGSSEADAISPDGRFVLFESYAHNLVPNDTNGDSCTYPPCADVFVRDRKLGKTERVNLGPGGRQANDTSYGLAISAHGRYVAFRSDATNLVPDDTNGVPDIFVRDRWTGRTERVSVGPKGVQANGTSSAVGPVMSADGRFVTFESTASNLVPGDKNGNACAFPPCLDVFVRDRKLGTTELVSLGPDGRQGNNESFAPAISADGRFVAFSSIATNLVDGDTNGQQDVFLRDRKLGTTRRISLGPHGAQANNASFSASLSANGTRVVFKSDATNLVPGDTNHDQDVFVRDRRTGTTERVSLRPDGGQTRKGSYHSAISADGQVAAFSTASDDLVPGDDNRTFDVFVRTR